jgi:uncharacterized protein (UPF0333 family)
MQKKGQITVELTIIIFIAIAIILNMMTIPLNHMSVRETESIGNSALAMKAVEAIATTANLVGIAGDGAKDYVYIDTRAEFYDLDCQSSPQNGIELIYYAYGVTVTDVPDKPGINLVYSGDPYPYFKPVDYPMDCSIPSSNFDNTELKICFENNGGTVWITDCT